MFVQLKRNWPGRFHRSVIVEGQVARVLEWEPGETLKLTDEAEIAAVQSDLGKSLRHVVHSTVLGKYVPIEACPPEPVEEDDGDENVSDETNAERPANPLTAPKPQSTAKPNPAKPGKSNGNKGKAPKAPTPKAPEPKSAEPAETSEPTTEPPSDDNPLRQTDA